MKFTIKINIGNNDKNIPLDQNTIDKIRSIILKTSDELERKICEELKKDE